MHFLALRTIHFLGLLSVLVEAHGYLAEVIIDGKKYEGNVPNANPFPSAIQQVRILSLPFFLCARKVY
jgi:hypothetical protein